MFTFFVINNGVRFVERNLFKMNEDKLSSDEVPLKFSEWLLAMGCPAEKVPTADKITLYVNMLSCIILIKPLVF